MSIELKIKSKHLSVESKIIRHEEYKIRNQIRSNKERNVACNPEVNLSRIRQSLHDHRVWDVRNEQRATFLARAYLAGQPYSTVERGCKDSFKRNTWITPRVVKMVNKYGKNKVERQDIVDWYST